jgi:p-aminobenzoyl-glutamate transporter AbgT
LWQTFLATSAVVIALSHIFHLLGVGVAYQGPIQRLTKHLTRSPQSTACSPLVPYFGMIVVFAQRYQKDAGVGTVAAMMLPFAAIPFGLWMAQLVLWYLLGVPVGV